MHCLFSQYQAEMNNTKHNSFISVLLTMLTALAVCMFFGLVYPHHLHYQEQFQLFLFDRGYAAEVMSVPGGLADYIGRFLTQFFIYAWVGAIIIGLLIAMIHIMTARLLGKGWGIGLSVVPPLLLVTMMCDENALLGSIVAILLAQLSAWGISAVGNTLLRQSLTIASLPLLYWALGPLAIVASGLIAVEETCGKRPRVSKGYIVVICILALLQPLLVVPAVAVEPERMFSGIHYLRWHGTDNNYHWYAALAAVALPAFAMGWTKCQREVAWWKTLLTALIAATGGALLLVKPAVNMKAENVMAYDFMARMQLWNRIQERAQQTPPNNAYSTSVVNLALAKSGLLGDEMFEFEQRGTTGLLPPFKSDAMSPLATSEVFFHLGMVNTAQRFVFEAQEAILDFQKSARCYKRLAETNLINGNYEVARKYLTTLRKTWFYSDWAQETLLLLGNEDAIDRHEIYGKIRKNRIAKDYFYDENNYAGMLEKLYLSNRSNRMALEYLLATYLLNKDLDRFADIFGSNDAVDYTSIPQHFQQALILWWSLNHGMSDNYPPGIHADVANGLKAFVNDMQRHQNNREWMKQHYGKTYWLYYVGM